MFTGLSFRPELVEYMIGECADRQLCNLSDLVVELFAYARIITI